MNYFNFFIFYFPKMSVQKNSGPHSVQQGDHCCGALWTSALCHWTVSQTDMNSQFLNPLSSNIIYVKLLHFLTSCDSLSYQATSTARPPCVCFTNAALKPLPAVNNATLCIGTHACTAAVGSMFTVQPVARTQQPAVPKTHTFIVNCCRCDGPCPH